MEVLSCYSWPGNVRELQNAIRRVLAMTKDPVISEDDLPDHIVTAAGKPEGDRQGFFDRRDEQVAQFEQEYLCDVLRRHEGDVNAAAADAQMPRGTLYRLLKKHGLNASDFRN